MAEAFKYGLLRLMPSGVKLPVDGDLPLLSQWNDMIPGKRYVVKITAMQKVQTIVDMVMAQLKQPTTTDACTLLVNGKPAHLDLPFRLANISPQAKLELKTGQTSRMGISDRGASQEASDKSMPSEDRAMPPADELPGGRIETSIADASTQHQRSKSVSIAAPPEASASMSEPAANDFHNHSQAHHAVQEAQLRQDAGSVRDVDIQLEDGRGAGPSASVNGILSSAQGQTEHIEVPSWCQALGLERDVKILSQADLESSQPSTEAENPPDDFYEFGVEDYARVMRGLQQKKQRAERGLLTAKHREQEEKEMAARFPRTSIRIFLPDGNILQMEFGSLDTVASLVQSVKKCLHPEVAKQKWALYTTPPKQVLKDGSTSLYKAGLCPGAKIYLSCESELSSILRPEVAEKKSSVPMDHEPPVQDVRPSDIHEKLSLPDEPAHGHQDNKQKNRSASGRKVPKWLKTK